MRSAFKIAALIVAGVASAAIPDTVFARETPAAKEAKAPAAAGVSSGDSLAMALATFWGKSAKLPQFTPSELDRFADGVSFALTDSTFSTRAYEQGLSLGANLAQGLQQMSDLGMPVDRKAFVEAVLKVIRGESVGFSVESAGEYIDRAISPLVDNKMPELTAASQAEFMAEAMKLDGAVTTPSGLVFQVLTEGEGEFPTEDDRVELEYTARLSDGTVFDKTDEPVNFNIVNLVDGLTEGIKMMRPGGTYRVIIPAGLGYGEKGIEGVIPPGAVLDFTVTLRGVDRGANLTK